MKERFKEFLVLIGCAVLFFWTVPGLCAEDEDEFELAPPPGMNVPQPADEERLPVPDPEVPDPEPKDEDDKTPEGTPEEDAGERLNEIQGEKMEETPDDRQEDLQKNENQEDETELLLPENTSKTEKKQAVSDVETDSGEKFDLVPEIFLEPGLEAEPEPEEEPEIQYVSTEEMTELKGKIQKILKIYRSIGLSTAENSPNDIMFFIMTYGCEAEVFLGYREANTHINAIGALCWNVPMKESVAFTGSTEKLMPRLGYGIQQYSGQLLAVMAIARVPIDYRFPAGWTNVTETEEKADHEKKEKDSESNVPKLPKGKKNFAIRNLVEFEQKNCLWGRDLSLTLIGLSYYLEPDDEWESSDGEKWTLERVVKNELDREMKLDDSSATNQLLGILCAIRCRKMRLGEGAITGEYRRAEVFMERYRKFVLGLQNEIGVWHPKFFALKGVTPNQPTEMLEASGHILRWLVTVTPKSELKDVRIFKAVKIVTELLEYQLTYWDPGNASGKEVEGIMTALHALTIFEKRAW